MGAEATDDADCPCGSGAAEAACCLPIRAGGAGLGTTAEQLMRARYSAYVRHDRSFLLSSWHPSTRPEQLRLDPGLEWLGLDVIERVGGGALDSRGTVEFRARFRRGGEFLELHERSAFERVDGMWHYLDGT